MSKKICISIILFYLILQIAICTAAVPRIEPYVNDFAHLLTQEEINALNTQADKIEQNTTYEIAIVTVQNTGGEDRVQFANELGDQNGVGKKGKDNGVVVLWSVEDGGAIATGRYSESILNDAKVVRIGRAARPMFDDGKYYNAFSYILTEIDKEIVASQDESITNSTNTSSGSNNNDDGKRIIMIFMIIAVAAWIFSKFFDMNLSDIFAGVAIGSILSGKSSGSSRSSGGGSFGGGSFGGGGGKF